MSWCGWSRAGPPPRAPGPQSPCPRCDVTSLRAGAQAWTHPCSRAACEGAPGSPVPESQCTDGAASDSCRSSFCRRAAPGAGRGGGAGTPGVEGGRGGGGGGWSPGRGWGAAGPVPASGHTCRVPGGVETAACTPVHVGAATTPAEVRTSQLSCGTPLPRGEQPSGRRRSDAPTRLLSADLPGTSGATGHALGVWRLRAAWWPRGWPVRAGPSPFPRGAGAAWLAHPLGAAVRAGFLLHGGPRVRRARS